MTPTRQAGFLLFAAFAAMLTASSQAQVPDDTVPQQPPAPIVRTKPRSPATLPPRSQTATPTTAQPGPQTPSSATTPPKHTPTRSTASSSQAGTSPEATPTTAPVKPKTSAQTPSASTATEHKTATTAEHRTYTPPPSNNGVNRAVIVLDPAHGGTDSGARIGDAILEKNVTLSLAFRLRSLLTARGFTVILTRDSDTTTEPNSPSNPLTLDDRAGIANHARGAACLLLHATGRGTGVHLYSSELDPIPTQPALDPWLTAQAAWVSSSQALERQIATALGRSRIALLSSAASVRPVDSLACPALVLELAPESDAANSISDADYQERVASAIAGALVFWKDAVQPPPRQAATATVTHTAPHHPATVVPKPEPEAQP